MQCKMFFWIYIEFSSIENDRLSAFGGKQDWPVEKPKKNPVSEGFFDFFQGQRRKPSQGTSREEMQRGGAAISPYLFD